MEKITLKEFFIVKSRDSMKKPWSITTTLRNPERLRGFLGVLSQLEGMDWSFENQEKFQILLIQSRLYGYGNTQFYNTLSKKQVRLLDDFSKDVPFEEAEKIFLGKQYEDPAMRGRQSINPLRKLGFVAIRDGKVCVTDLGKLFLQDGFDLGEVFLRSFLKWQIPNLDSDEYSSDVEYDIKPFVGMLHLINAVNEKEERDGNEAKGISKKEFALFVPTLIHYGDVEKYADKIIALRTGLQGKERHQQNEFFEKYREEFTAEFLGTDNDKDIQSLLSNLKDYGDNAIRYFRLTKYLHIRGGGFYVDLEPRRMVEIMSLLEHDTAQSQSFESKEAYLEYIANISQPQLPWETRKKHTEIITNLVSDIQVYEKGLRQQAHAIKDYKKMGDDALKQYVAELRAYRKVLQDEIVRRESQDAKHVTSYIELLKNIFEQEDRPLLLEKLSALSLVALNDALNIQPNYPVGDDNEPTFTAPGNMPDIECFYETFNTICEVTMLTGRDQWYNEGQPVMRHLRNFEDRYGDKPSYCLFIAPQLHRDTVNTFWNAVKYEYEGKRQKIIPLSITQFVSVLNILLEMKAKDIFLHHADIMFLYDEIVALSEKSQSSNEWLESIPTVIVSWGKKLTSEKTT